jgi:phosphatidylserine/phosphatidylglycerophosphate/cardiolipin synthase-like enzyme
MATRFFKKSHKKTNIMELEKYYNKVSNGSIYLNNFTDDAFYIDRRKAKITSEKVFNYTEVQDLFATDVHKYIQNEDAEDFIEAKKKFYSRQSYHKRKHKFYRPYNYLSAWNSLNHPQIKELKEPLYIYDKTLVDIDYDAIDSNYFKVSFQNELDDITNTELTYGNELEQLDNNESYFARLKLIASAEKYFFGVVMAHYCDTSSTKLIDAMIERAQSGVDVRMLVEGLWTSIVFKKCVKKMRKGGVKVILSNNVLKKDSLFTVLHDKIWIADGERAIIGGQNVQNFENGSTGFNMHTRDKDVLVKKGPAITDMLGEYIKLWNHFKRSQRDQTIKPYEVIWKNKVKKERAAGVRGNKFYANWLGDKDKRMNGVCRVIVQGKQTTNGIVAKAYMKIIENAQKSIKFSTPNLKFKTNGKGKKLNSKLVYAILDKAKFDEVKVDVISNGIDASGTESGFHLRGLAKKAFDKKRNLKARFYLKVQDWIARILAKSQYKTMSHMTKTLGVDAWTLSNHTHAKQMIFDRILTSTGSFNYDSYSYKNHESTLICLDKKLSREAEEGFVMDMINSVPVY